LFSGAHLVTLIPCPTVQRPGRTRQSINFRKVAPILGTYLKAHYFLFSAKAACSFKPGATPQVTTSFQKQALKARINRDYREVNRAFSADDFLSL
jgi:hypothetical protein